HVRPLRRPPRARVPGRPPADRRPLLHELGRAGTRSGGAPQRLSTGCTDADNGGTSLGPLPRAPTGPGDAGALIEAVRPICLPPGAAHPGNMVGITRRIPDVISLDDCGPGIPKAKPPLS